ncbi:MAG: DUF2269 family protein [Candidatus Limnocylindrales bacterium]
MSIFLFLHVLGAIAVFGPTFVFPIIGRQAQRSPQNGPFAAALADLIERRVVIPGAVVQGLTGLALIIIIGVDFSSSAWHWLGVGIALYLVAVVFAVFVQAPTSEHMVELTKAMAGGPPTAAAAAGAGGNAGGAPAGPPPEIAATAMKLQRGGMFLTVLIVAIVFLMVVKPTF